MGQYLPVSIAHNEVEKPHPKDTPLSFVIFRTRVLHVLLSLSTEDCDCVVSRDVTLLHRGLYRLLDLSLNLRKRTPFIGYFSRLVPRLRGTFGTGSTPLLLCLPIKKRYIFTPSGLLIFVPSGE